MHAVYPKETQPVRFDSITWGLAGSLADLARRLCLEFMHLVLSVRRTPHPVIATIKDNRDHIRVLLYPYYTTITGRGVLLICLNVVVVAALLLSPLPRRAVIHCT